jgi:hypothetical protein
VPPRASLLFKHALVQDITYSMLLLDLRRSLHGQIARALEERFPDAMEGRPETLAHHFTEAGRFEKAVGYRCRAGRQSMAKSGFVEAITQLRTRLRLIAEPPDTRERKPQDLELQIALAGALTVVKGYAHPEGSRGVRPGAQLDLGDRASGCDHSFFGTSWALGSRFRGWPASQRRPLTTLTSSCRSLNFSQILGW